MNPIAEAADPLYRKSVGAIKMREKAAIARKHRPALTSFFRKQRDLVLEQIAERKYLFTEAHRKMREEVNQLTPQNVDRIWDGIRDATTGNLQDIIANIETEALPKGADQIRRLFAVGPAPGKFWNLPNPRAVSWFMNHGGSVDYIKGINDTTGNQLKRVITQGLDEGWSYNDTAKEIRKFYDGMSRERSTTIAVHESAQAYEAGNRAFADSIADEGVEMEKMYQTSEDDLVSDLCQGNQDEGWIPLNQGHKSGVQEPPGHIRCRCYEVYRAVSVNR